ncbi:MAG: hypothetical protein KAH77_03385 [Thiomargarita sp.]|nr:hypothetical protein [Thiomargarita sp.]
MNHNYFRTLLSFLLSIMLTGCSADEADKQDDSWWDQSKQAVNNMWDTSTQHIDTDAIKKKNEELFAKIWGEITPTLEEVLHLEGEHEALPNSAWILRDKEDNQEDIDELLDEAVSILSMSHSDQTRQEIRDIEAEIRAFKKTIAEYHQAKVTAPTSSAWVKTVQDYEDKIVALNKRIEQKNKKIIELKERFAQELAQKGLFISSEQLEVLLSSVVGDDIIQSSVVYDNVKQISQQLMELTISTGEDIEISQRYYGMYTVLLKTLIHMQKTFIGNIDTKYLPRIDKIAVEVQNLKKDTIYFLRRERDNNSHQHLKANLDAQKLTLQTATLYKRHLLGQRGKMVKAMEKTDSDLQIAQNTYKTVRLSGELVNLLRTSQKSFELLLNIQVPELLLFENKQMKQEFAILTKKLAQ